MLENPKNIFPTRRKEPPVEQQVKMSPIVRDLLTSGGVPDDLSPEERAVVEQINKLKGTLFHETPGYILSVMETGSNIARALGRDFDLNLLLYVMDEKVRRNGIPVDLDNPTDVDKAWSRYFNEGN